jgi:hypothetical protein
MTKFFQDNNPPKVWDKVKNKVTVIFQEGEFETDDPALIDLLVRVGYRHNGILPKPEPEKPVEDRVKEPRVPEVKTEDKKSKPKMVRKKK